MHICMNSESQGVHGWCIDLCCCCGWRHAERLRNNVSGVRALWPSAHQHTHNLITLGSNNAAAALSLRALEASQTLLLHAGPRRLI